MCAMLPASCGFQECSGERVKEQRSDEHLNKVWEELLAKADEFDCEEPVLPRRRLPKRIDEANSTSHFDVTPEDMYHRYYFEVLDTLIGQIERRLGSPSFTLYAKVESVLENATLGKDVSTDDIKEIVQHFKEDLVECDLITELKMVKNVYCEKSFGYKEFKERIILYKSIFPVAISHARYLCHSRAIIFFTKTHQNLPSHDNEAREAQSSNDDLHTPRQD